MEAGLDLEEIQTRVKAIRNLANDSEAAHSAEDALWFDVLTAIAEGDGRAQALAYEALETREIDFLRWSA